MHQKPLLTSLLLVCSTFLASCASKQVVSTPDTDLPNPASAYCEQQGNRLVLMTAADGSQRGVCIFSDGSSCDEWAFFRGECAPGMQVSPASPTTIPTAMPIDPEDYQGWWTYTQPVYNFSIMLPADWTITEESTSDSPLNGHLLNLHPAKGSIENIRMTFRRTGEETLLWPTGVGQGEFIPQGMLEVSGQAAQRLLLVCPGGEVTSIWYHQSEEIPNISRGDLEFGIIFSASVVHCEAGYTLGGKIQQVGENIIASLKVP